MYSASPIFDTKVIQMQRVRQGKAWVQFCGKADFNAGEKLCLVPFERGRYENIISQYIYGLALGEILSILPVPVLRSTLPHLGITTQLSPSSRYPSSGIFFTQQPKTMSFENLITMTHHSMPETAGTAIWIDSISAEFVHFTYMMYLSYVKYNLIPHTHRTNSPQPPRNNKGPKLAHS